MKNLTLTNGLISNYQTASVWIENVTVGSKAVLIEYESGDLKTEKDLKMTPCVITDVITLKNPKENVEGGKEYVKKVSNILQNMKPETIATAEFVTNSAIYYITAKATGSTESIEAIDFKSVTQG